MEKSQVWKELKLPQLTSLTFASPAHPHVQAAKDFVRKVVHNPLMPRAPAQYQPELKYA